MKRLQDPLSWRELKLAWEEEERKKNRTGISGLAPSPCDQVRKGIRGVDSIEIAHLNALVFRFPRLFEARMLRGKNVTVRVAVIELGRHRRPLRRHLLQ
jgi:hypothetical protein